MKTHDDWKKATIHLECVTSTYTQDDIMLLTNKKEKGEISNQELADLITNNTKNIRYRGSALLFEHENRNYLFTARHVLFDEHSFLNDPVRKGNSENIFMNIFRVKSLNEAISNSNDQIIPYLMNLGTGPSDVVPYTFSDVGTDLAIISLRDTKVDSFANHLISNGYSPIKLEDIEDGPDSEGQEIYAVGYPQTSNIAELNLHQAIKNWTSSIVSLPVTVFGRVSMLHEMLDFFWADISIYPGNSGGPIIGDNGKLVGIVSGQGLVESARIPIAKIIKAKHIKTLLAAQIEKDNTYFALTNKRAQK